MTVSTLRYKGFEGSVDCDFADNLLTGKVIGIRAGLIYEAETLKELKKAFEQTVDDYLAYCTQQGLEPEKPYSGNLNIRLGSERHQALAAYARKHGLKLNDVIREAIDSFVR